MMLESCDWESKIALERFDSVFGSDIVDKIKPAIWRTARQGGKKRAGRIKRLKARWGHHVVPR